jgi:hypothetical protein
MRHLSRSRRCWCDYEDIMIMFKNVLCCMLFASDVDDGRTVPVAVVVMPKLSCNTRYSIMRTFDRSCRYITPVYLPLS